MSHPVPIHPFPYPIIGETLHSDTQGGPSGRLVKTANLSALSRSSSHRCETSQVVRWFFPGISRFFPHLPTHSAQNE